MTYGCEAQLIDGQYDSDYGDVGCSTRVSDYIEWIAKTKELINTILNAGEILNDKFSCLPPHEKNYCME